MRRLFLGVSLLVVLLALVPARTSAQDAEIDLIVEFLGDKDKSTRALAFDQIRTAAKGEAATLKFAELLPKVPPESQVGLLSALAGRADKAAAPAVRKLLAEAKDEPVRVAAIDALGSLGAGEEDAKSLVTMLFAGPTAEQKAARASLIRISGDEASSAIVAAMKEAKAADKVTLIEILTTRRTGLPEIVAAASDSDASVRSAAMTSLKEIATPEQLPGMLQGVLTAQAGKERVAAERAIAKVCERIANKDERATPLIAAFDALPAKDKQTPLLLPTLGRVGGPEALKIVERAFATSDSKMHVAGLTALCNWPDGSIASRLLELARTEEHPQHRKLAFKALIRVAAIDDKRSDQRRLDMVRTTFAMCQGDAERNQVLDRAKLIRTLETLHFVVPFLDKPEFSQQACETIVEMAHHVRFREANKAEFDMLLDRVIELSDDAIVKERANRYKKGQTWLRAATAE
jgi:HEAT repeat protein